MASPQPLAIPQDKKRQTRSLRGMNPVRGELISGDKNGSNTSSSSPYSVELDLLSRVDVKNGANYKLHPVLSHVMKLRDQTTWANGGKTTLYTHGGPRINNTPPDDGVSHRYGRPGNPGSVLAQRISKQQHNYRRISVYNTSLQYRFKYLQY
ncbi:uncharacterized protein DSM5745_04372 [Aspergillus mulundensis]|uniref:Uncharacterized protein n=1 Tax=Aspergillus mulundensis TaxID=1810919 RepID=A0A3D8SCJ9_9EURO|nr:hypothetical protein DSM5745_04372 [Aspergillus mulundensis]RDW84046.1 hypothetical protein DSM5745_04372 [Aspergillus mulundensis]